MASILYAATDEGVVTLKSTDGLSWNVEASGLEDWSVSEVAVAPSAPNKVFAGTRGDGVWLSEDFGRNWKKPCYGKPGPGKVRCLTIDPQDPNTLYAGTEPIDVFVSRDAGKRWKRFDSVWTVPWVETVDYPVATVEPHVRDIVVDPKDSKTIYIALQVGYILKTTDGGASWRLLNKDLDADVHTIVIHPQNTEKLFIATGGHDYRKGKTKGKALYCSPDGGESWLPMAADFNQEYSVPLIMDPKNPEVLYSALAAGQPGQWRKRPTGAESLVIRSLDGGNSWQKLDGDIAKASKSFVEAIVIDEAQPSRVYAAQRNGELFSSENGGETWTKLDVRLPEVSDMKGAQA
jgi:photosystem II stability/assembly factor-like uncharacterized protein